MLMAPQVRGESMGSWRRSALVSNFVSFDAVVNQDDIRLVFDWDVADLPVQQENIAQVDDLETNPYPDT